MAVEQFKKINPDGMASRNGEKFLHPPLEKSPDYLEEKKSLKSNNNQQYEKPITENNLETEKEIGNKNLENMEAIEAANK